jgi:rod shape-determining protein MreC
MSNKPFVNITATPKAMLDRNRELLIVWGDSAPVSLSTASNEKAPAPQPLDLPIKNGSVHEAAKGNQVKTGLDDQTTRSGLTSKAPARAQSATAADNQSVGNVMTRKVPTAKPAGVAGDE